MGRTLWTWEHLPKNNEENADTSWLNEGDAVENVNRLKIGGHRPESFAVVNSGVRFPQTIQHDIDSLDLIGKLAQPGAKITIVQAVGNSPKLMSASKLVSQMKLAGLVGLQDPKPIESLSDEQLKTIREILSIPEADTFEIVRVECSSPNFASGSSKPLSFAQKIKKPEKKPEKKVWTLTDMDDGEGRKRVEVWSLADMDDDDVDLIDQDELLEEEDLVKPDQASLRVCGTTGKRKACKDCSCGLAEEIESGGEIKTKSFNSSCGSCYLGDAFRCASCPYLGMPAFKPGEKIQLSQRQLNADK